MSLGRYEQQRQLTALRHAESEWSAIPLDVLRSALCRLERAFEAFFRRCRTGDTPGFPRFRSRVRYESLGIPRARVDIDGKRGLVAVPRLGAIRFHAYRPLRGIIRDVAVKRSAKGWWLCVQVELGAAPEKRSVTSAVGVDLGLTTFAALSDGTLVSTPKHYRHAEARLAEHQRTLSRKQRGSRGHLLQRAVVARTHERVKNARLDFHRKLAVTLFASYDLVAYEALHVNRMVHGNLAKAIYDAGWAQFIGCLKAKAEDAGLWAVPVDPRGTSQRCSACGERVPKTLSERVHRCGRCGLVLDRDVNAARNVLALGTSAARTATAPVVDVGQRPT